MKIGEILELSLTQSLAEIAKEHLSIGKEKARSGLQKAGCYSQNGMKGWFFDGDEKRLEQSIYDFVEPRKIHHKPSPNVPTNVHKERKKEPTNEPMNQRSVKRNESSLERMNVVRKRSSFDLEVGLMKELKVQAILHDRHVYEIVETALRQYLNDLKKESS